MSKVLVLNAKETKEWKENGSVIVSRNGLSFGVNSDREVTPVVYSGEVVNPLAFGSNRLVLTINQAKELQQKGTTTHTKNGVTFDIFQDEETGSCYAIPQVDTYSSILLKGEY